MFMGVDIGTSSVKAVVITPDGEVRAEASAPLPILRPQPLWSEQNPEDWWQAANAAVGALDAGLRAQVQAVGLSGQMHGATLLGEDDAPLRPAILWNDGRSARECADLQAAEPEFVSRGANTVMPGFTAPKLAWVRRHEPDVFDQIRTVLLPKDYVRLRMTGERASDVSDSAGTLWMDVADRTWRGSLLAACGLDESHMPALHEGADATGVLRADVAQAWGMARVRVVAGGGDNAAGAVGAGVVNDGDTLMSLGTSGVIFTAGERHRANPDGGVHAFCHAVAQRWHLMSVMLSAASCLDWACRATNTASVDALVALAERAARPQSRTMFLPYLSGERTPHNDPFAQGVLFGLDHDTGPADIAQAVLEGVAFAMADGLDALLAAGAQIDALTVVGGGARSPYWGGVLASALGRPLIYRDGADVGPAVGAAKLAAHGTLGGSIDEAFAPPPVTAVIEPDADRRAHYADARPRFGALYAALKPTFAGAHHA